MTELACCIGAFPEIHRELYREVAASLVANAVAIYDSDRGIVFHLRPDDYEAANSFIAIERQCCPFLLITLEVTPDRGPIWLRLSGPPGTADFLRKELRLPPS